MMAADKMLKIAQDENVLVSGIGPASVMVDEMPGHLPDDLLPGPKSPICFGIPVPRAVYQMPTFALETVCRSQDLYYRWLDTLSINYAALRRK